MSEASKQYESQGLTLGDRLNYPYILANAILSFETAIVKNEGEYSEQEIYEASQGLYYLLPRAWSVKDNQFEKDIEEAKYIQLIDNRKFWCGRRIGKPQWREVERFNPYKLFHASINLLNRRGMLSKKKIYEIMSDLVKEEIEKGLEKIISEI